MAESNEPLREHEVGTFGELSARPNPENLVILTVPPFEDTLPLLQQQLGRELTQRDINLHRRKATSIVVNPAEAEKMQAARAGRNISIKTDPERRAPTVKSSYSDMPVESGLRKVTAVDLFGQHLFSLRNKVVERLRKLIDSDDSRKERATVQRKELDDIAALQFWTLGNTLVNSLRSVCVAQNIKMKIAKYYRILTYR